jgi:signal transduction histidine kinase/HAMP domain-containing protein
VRLGIKGKQIAGVTAIVGVAVVGLSGLYVTRLVEVVLRESFARGELLSNAIFHRAREVVTTSEDPYAALRMDPGLRSILESSIYGESVTGASVLDVEGTVIASSDPARVGVRRADMADLAALLDQSPLRQLEVIYSSEGQTLEVRQPMMLGDEAFGAIRIGVSTLLMRQELNAALRPALITAVVALAVAVFVAALLAQLLLRPIHVIQSGLTRLGQGEFGVTLDLPPGDEFGELGTFFNTMSQQLSADRTALVDQKAHLQSAVEHLEDAVALFNPSGELLFSNPAMQAVLPAQGIGGALRALLPDAHPYRAIVEETLATRRSRGPLQAKLDEDVLVMTHAIEGTDRSLVGVLLVSRNLASLSRVQSTLDYSRKLVALGRLTAGIAHEVRNPLNAMMIHLELMRTKLLNSGRALVAAAPSVATGSVIGLAQPAPQPVLDPAVQNALPHVEVIESEIRRLEEIVQGFLKFTRPEELRLHPVGMSHLLEEIVSVIQPEARAGNVKVVLDVPASLRDVLGDATMLRQAFLNLAINACQAMPNGGTLRISGAAAPRNRVEIRVEDSGVGIRPEDLSKIFDLYYTTKERGTGIGLSMVYRIVQMHDGEIEVHSTPGRGTTFRVLLPRATEI